VTSRDDKDPKYVSFRDGAQLLVRKGLVSSMTKQGLDYIAKRKDWPFGDARGKEPYLMAGRTRLMRTKPFLRYFERVYTPKGRGPDQKPRQRPGGVS
jgi:hypothetical protein